jgi:hypothetical protein
MQEAIDKCENLAERPKRVGADQAERMADAVHKAADALQDQMPKAAEYVHAAAAQMEKGADTLRNKGVGELLTQFNDLGRKQPLTLFGAALATGFVASRFIKSSAKSH